MTGPMTGPPASPGPKPEQPTSLIALLELDQVGEVAYRTVLTFPDPYPLFGGQVAAQALRAAGLTVAADRMPHSLHGYFLRAGDATRPIDYDVELDRDGGSFSARRVSARQDGKVIFTLSASFASAQEEQPARQELRMPQVSGPREAAPWRFPRLFSFEGREVAQSYPHDELRTRFWARCTEKIGADPLLNACVLTYVSDHSTGLAYYDTKTHRSLSSLDHALWFHRPILAEDWLLLDFVPQVVAHGRGWYRGGVYRSDGVLVASLAQEALYRPHTGRYFHLD